MNVGISNWRSRDNGAEIGHLNLGHNKQAISVSVDARNLVGSSVDTWTGGGHCIFFPVTDSSAASYTREGISGAVFSN